MPFVQLEGYRSPYVNTIAALLQEGPRAQANAALAAADARARAIETRGAASANIGANIGNTIGNILQLPEAMRQQELARQLQQIQMERDATQLAVAQRDLTATPAVKTREVTIRMPDGSTQIRIVPDVPDQTFTSAAPAPAPLGTKTVTVKNADGSETTKIVADEPGQEFTGAAPPAKTPENIDAAIFDAFRRGDVPEQRRLLQLKTQVATATREPNQGPAPQYQWAVDPQGNTRLMSVNEIRQTGAKQPPTADMRNKEMGRGFVDKSIGSLEDLSKSILTKVGPAQRLDAIKRGAETVFGNDPKFKTYQDARFALAGNLAVAQQGSRPSDSDIKSIWLPLVPDPYTDTKDSAEMKWSLIRTMSGVPPSQQAPKLTTLPTGVTVTQRPEAK